MPMIAAFTAAEIAAAAAAAEAAAAAAAASTAAAGTTAATTAATAAAAPTAAAAATPAAAGIMGAEALGAGAQALGAGAGTTGAGIAAQAAPAIEAATAIGGQGAGTAATQSAMQSAMQTAAGAPGGIAAPAGIAGVPEAATTLAPAGEVGMSASQQAYLQASQAGLGPGIAPGVQPLPAYPSVGLSPEALAATGNAPAQSSIYSLTNPATAPGPAPLQYQLSPPGAGVNEGLRLSAHSPTGFTTASPGASSFGKLPTPQPSLFDKALSYAEKNPFTTGAMLYTGAYKMGLLDPKGAEMPQKKSYGNQYTISKDFQASEPTPNVYTPSYKSYAEGGVMSVGGPSSQVMEPRTTLNPMDTVATMSDGGMPAYAKGGKTLSDSLDFYKELAETRPGKGASAPKADADVGIYYDLDPDTRYQDALTAAQIRQAKLNKRANLQMPTGGVMKRPTPMGQLNLAPPGGKAQDGGGTTEAAQGGIMQAGSSLGGYAAGGNPRLLKGPGDGMSDNIPAVIGRKQPARLADGEFVIPADVVSHLGNGSTEAGAKRLHEMMTRVRKERTGNPKQGKQINPNKFMPK